jgi:peptidoglycan/xylan/chitin deacetylase (PgdA/CDA1 family)
MGLLKIIARKFIFPVVTVTGLEKLLSLFTKYNYLILVYHGVVKNKNTSLSGNHCSLEEFKNEIQYLKKNFDIIPLTELFELSNRNVKPPRKTIAITFDDGYENNYINAYPVLKKSNIPATIFVVASCISNPDHLLWYDLVDIIKGKINFSEFSTLSLNLSEEKLRQVRSIKDISQLRNFLKSVNNASKQVVLDAICSKLEVQKLVSETDPEFHRMLTTSQIHEMSDSGLIEIGSHSLTHPNLDMLDDIELNSELQESKKLIENITGKSVVSIAFPDGAYNEKVKTQSMLSNYKYQCSVIPRLESDKSDHSIRPRFCISNTTTADSNMIQVNAAYSTYGF